MADTTNPGSGAAGNENGDQIKNVKEEMNRKLGNMETKVSTLEQTNRQLLAQLQAMAPAAPAAPKKNIQDVWFDKPDEAAARIKAEAKQEIREEFANLNAQQQKQNVTLNALVAEFPELSDPQHELTKKAVEIYSAMPEDEKVSPAAYKAAVREAALEFNVKPRSKRGDDYEDFSGLRGGSSGQNSQRSNGDRQRRGGLDPQTVEFAKLVGVNTDDPKVAERLKQNHGRKRYDRWE